MKAEDLVLVTVDYKVIALRKTDGEVVWETELVKKFFKPSPPFVTLAVDESGVYAHAINELYCLDLTTGQIMWSKELSSARWIVSQGFASIATLRSSSGSAVGQAARNQSERQRSD
jgi:outer membrane protein assembly factor BamB